MSVEQVIAIVSAVSGGLATILVAVLPIIREVRRTHRLVNSRMDELVALTRKAALAEGRSEQLVDQVVEAERSRRL